MRIAFNVTLVFLSACLLFLIQPIFAKVILPWFGGGAGVWAVCLVFFQTTLLLGYLYSHLLKYLNPRHQWIQHLAIILLVAVFAPFAFSSIEKPLPDAQPYWTILSILTIHLGLPFFLLSTTSIIVQNWYANEDRPSHIVYELYSYSNLGSLLALVSYPFLMEPKIDLHTQFRWWVIAFEIFAALYFILTIWNRRLCLQKKYSSEIPSEQWPHGAKCFLLAMAGSALLVAFTNHICYDIASFPFLWIAPLAVYLLTFILCFQRKPLYSRTAWVIVLIFALFIAINPLDIIKTSIIGENIITITSILLLTLFACLMVVHGEMVSVKPPPEHLTKFYLLICAGGAAGSVLISLIVPMTFSAYSEYALLLAGVFAYGIYLLVFQSQTFFSWQKSRRKASIVVAFSLVAIFLGLVDYLIDEAFVSHRWRNFYGALYQEEYQECRKLTHGNTLHGGCLRGEDDENTPITYYSYSSGFGLLWNQLKQERPNPMRVGVIGMGVATAASYGRAGDTIRFYEINPLIPKIAREQFPFIKHSPANIEIALGDARLSLEREENQQFDLLVLDAFSSDAIPMHLLTKEAFQTYLRHLKSDGFILVHVTNRHLNLLDPMICIAQRFDLYATHVRHRPVHLLDNIYYESEYVVFSRKKINFTSRPAETFFLPLLKSSKNILWTDSFHSPLSALEIPELDDELPIVASCKKFFKRVWSKMKRLNGFSQTYEDSK